MEIKKLELNIEKKRKGIINVFLISEVGSIVSCNLIINEFPDKYDIIHVNQKTDLIDLASVVYEFIISEYFDDKKPLIIRGNSITITKNSIYPIVYQSLKPLFEK